MSAWFYFVATVAQFCSASFSRSRYRRTLSAVCCLRTLAAHTGQYFEWLDCGLNAVPHSAHGFAVYFVFVFILPSFPKVLFFLYISNKNDGHPKNGCNATLLQGHFFQQAELRYRLYDENQSASLSYDSNPNRSKYEHTYGSFSARSLIPSLPTQCSCFHWFHQSPPRYRGLVTSQ